MGRIILSTVLGLFSILAFFIGASLFEVQGKTSVREVLAGCIAGALYLTICQFLIARNGGRRLHPGVEETGMFLGEAFPPRWRLVVAMIAPLFAIFLIIAATAKGKTDVVAGFSMLLSGCVGSLTGALLAHRVSASVDARTARSQAAWHMILQIGGGLLLAVAIILVGIVIPLAVKNPSYRLQWGTLGPVGFVVNSVPHVCLAALIFWRSRGGRFPVIPGVFALILGFLLVLPASSYTYGTSMRLAAIVLFACAGIDLIVGALSLAAAARGCDLAEGNMNSINSGGFYKSIIGTLAVLAVLVTFFAIRMLSNKHDYYSESMIYASNSHPFGMSYGDWQAAYWRYVVSIPLSMNPIVDTTGANCSVAQAEGPVFFLNSALLGSWVTRTCTVSASKALLVQIAGTECSNVQPPPAYGRDSQDMRACAGSIMDGVGVNTLMLTVDEMTVPGLQRMRSQSPYFEFTMPATDNFLRLDGVSSGFSVTDAYTVMLKPLSPGNHVIHIEGAYVSGRFAHRSFGATYHLKVQ